MSLNIFKKDLMRCFFTLLIVGFALTPLPALALTPGYYAPFKGISENIECKNGYKYNQENMQNGTCRVNWNTVIGNTVNTMIDTAISGGLGNHLP